MSRLIGKASLRGILVPFCIFRLAFGVERHSHSAGVERAAHRLLEIGRDGNFIRMDKLGSPHSPHARAAVPERMMRHEHLQHQTGVHSRGSVLDLKVHNDPGVASSYDGENEATNTSHPLDPEFPGVAVPITNLEDAEAEADKVGKIVAAAEAEAGMPDTVHTTPYPGKDDNSEEEEEKALMWIAIALIVICLAWSCGWVVFMRRFATKKEQIEAGLVPEEEVGEEEEAEEEQEEEPEKEGPRGKKERLADLYLTGVKEILKS